IPESGHSTTLIVLLTPGREQMCLVRVWQLKFPRGELSGRVPVTWRRAHRYGWDRLPKNCLAGCPPASSVHYRVVFASRRYPSTYWATGPTALRHVRFTPGSNHFLKCLPVKLITNPNRDRTPKLVANRNLSGPKSNTMSTRRQSRP